MSALERLKGAMVRVEALVDFYKQSPTVTIDMMDSTTEVTMEDLETLLDGIKDRYGASELTQTFKTQKEIENDIRVAKEINEREEKIKEDIKQLGEEARRLEGLIAEEKGWLRGYNEGYEDGRGVEAGRIP